MNTFDENEIDIENSFEEGYELTTHEKQAEFDKKRNYQYTNTDELENYRRQAMELWSDSCTTPRKQ